MALSTFRSYIRDSIQSETSKRIPLENKRFKLALGEDATVLLARLGFTFESAADSSSYAHWRLPGPGSLLQEGQRAQLMDIYDELLVLIQQRPDAERLKVGEAAFRPPPGTKDIERVLGCLDCEFMMNDALLPLIVLACVDWSISAIPCTIYSWTRATSPYTFQRSVVIFAALAGFDLYRDVTSNTNFLCALKWRLKLDT